MDRANWVLNVLHAFSEMAGSFRAALQNKEDFSKFLADFGWELDPSIDDLRFGAVQEAFCEEITLLERMESSDVELVAALPLFMSSLQRSRTPQAAWPAPLNTGAFWAEFPSGLLDSIQRDVVAGLAPALFAILRFGAVFRNIPRSYAPSSDGMPSRPEYSKRTIDWRQLVDLILTPGKAFASAYCWDSDDDEFRALELLGAIAAIFDVLPVSSTVGKTSESVYSIHFDSTLPSSPSSIEDLSVIPYVLRNASGAPLGLLRISLNVVPIPKAGTRTGKPVGICIYPLLTGDAQESLILAPGALLSLEGAYASKPVFAEIRPSSVQLISDFANTTNVTGSARLDAKCTKSPWRVLGSASGHRVEVSQVYLRFKTEGSYTEPEFCIDAGINDAAILIDFSCSDGFLKSIFGTEIQRIGWSLEAGWSTRTGFKISGAGDLSISIPIHETLFETISIDRIDISLSVDPLTRRVSFTASATAGLDLGPILVSVERVGFRASVESHGDRLGNFGPINLTLDFLPPAGAGLSIDAGNVVGGGFLNFDDDNKRYSGALALRFGEIALSAIGVITTKMPDGADDYSLLISICATFTPPIQLSFGFTLSGVGGLIGVNRRMDVEALRTGLKAGTLGSILFPDPETLIPNAARIISDMGTAFPVQAGRYVVGPMVKLGLGSPNIITADVGIFLELPEPVKAVILGQLEAILPEKTNPQIVIRLDVLGVLEFSKRQLTFQAVLYDSSVMGYPVSGDSAFLLGWGDDPRFALSLGGFHPRFTAPEPSTVFANLRRLSIDISASPSLHLTCSAYQALTPNSLQFGAQLDILAKKSGAEITGHLGFDTLIYFSPFSFNVTMNAKVKISYEGETFAAIDMTLWLSGPRPWVGRVNAKIKLLFITVPIKFTVTWGDETPVPIPAVDPWLDVQRALQRRESWSSTLPAGKSMVEVLRSDMASDEQIVLHPLGRLEVRQKVPLGMVLSRASSAPITGHNRFEIESVVVGDYEINKSHGLVPVEEFFARGQWEDLGDRALSVPSFEKMQAGVAVSTGAVQIGGEPTSIDSSYETILIDENGLSSSLDQFAQPTSMVSGVLDARIKRDARRRAGPQSCFVCKPSAFTVMEEGYSVTDADSVTRSDKTTAQHMSRKQADQLLCALQKANTVKTCFVVPDYEVAQ